MSNFWIGATVSVLVFGAEFIKDIVSPSGIYLKLRQAFLWFPFSISVALLSGYISELLGATDNTSWTTLIVGLTIVVNILCCNILEKNLSYIGVMREQNEERKAFAIASSFSMFCFLVLIVSSYLLIGWLCVVFGIVFFFFLYLPSFFWLWSLWDGLARDSVKRKLQEVLSSINARVDVRVTSDDVCDFLTSASVDDVELFHRVCKERLESVRLFSPWVGDRLVAGIDTHFLSTPCVKMLAKEVQGRLIEELTRREYMAKAIVGNEGEHEESLVMLRRSGVGIGDDEVSCLVARRRALSAVSSK